ncbi:hypothetical protein QA649_08900 [Bradyrhizobium sp. CB1717]|uniref:hypothetical protein n=1 Tax=Bradyrhizobium sp. CB1717 TaxID=3039154 RepID=UPI0024B2423A|nr:hypothetical protein [Bradyrhizobium sp. CB1717]WFU26308.1 hypothetical protein QA649_08900 [Bradyrhizobium sp. CB1717]
MPDFESEIISLQCAAEWRRTKAREHPEDARNAKAAALLDRLASDLERSDGAELSLLTQRYEQEEGFVEAANSYLSRIGFDHAPANGTEYLRALIALKI